MTDIDSTLMERGTTHGHFSDNARIMQRLKEALREEPRWVLLRPTHREALEMIAHKMGRIISGNPDHTDHWHDIAGYATLIHQEITRNAACTIDGAAPITARAILGAEQSGANPSPASRTRTPRSRKAPRREAADTPRSRSRPVRLRPLGGRRSSGSVGGK